MNCVHAYQNSLKENQQNSKSKYLNAHCIYTPAMVPSTGQLDFKDHETKYTCNIYMTSKFYFEPAYIGDYIIKPVGK